MNVLTLVRKEIGHRKLGFVLSVLVAAVAAATFLSAVTLWRGTDLETSRLLDEKVQATESEMAKLEDEIRISMKGLGFNLFIFPEAQEMIGLEGQINCIQTLECNCAMVDRLGDIRGELGEILPGTKIVEHQSTALARAEALRNN